MIGNYFQRRENQKLAEMATAAESALDVFMQGFAEAVLQAYVKDPYRDKNEPIDQWIDGAIRINLLIGRKLCDYYTLWFTTFLRLAQQNGKDPFELLNESLDRTLLSTRFVPMKLFVFEGQFYLCLASWYEEHHGSDKLCGLRPVAF